MKLLKKFNERFGLTKNDGRIILFLVIAFVAGSAIKIWQGTFAQSKTVQTVNYSALDSEFERLSNREIDSIKEAQNTDTSTSSLADSNKGEGLTGDLLSNKEELKPNSTNPNTANLNQLKELPGIGPAIAQRIIDYRKKHGKFHSIEDVKNVKGIGKKKFEGIKKFLTLEH